MVFLLFSHPYCFNLMFDSNSSVCVVAGGGGARMCVLHVLCMCMYVDTGGQLGYSSSGISPFSFLFIGRGIL